MRTIPDSVLKELAALSEMSDEDIDYSDIPETSAQDWPLAVRGKIGKTMLDFTVPNNPGWGKRILEKEGSEEGQVGAISPKMLAAIDAIHPLTPLDDSLADPKDMAQDKALN